MSIGAKIFIIFFVICLFTNPRIDVTREKDVLLWYGRRKRRYLKLW